MKQASIRKNFIMNAVLMVSMMLFPLITFPYASRVLLPEGMGKVSFATGFVNYFIMLAQLGIPTYGIRACAQVRDDRVRLSRTAQELEIINLGTFAIAYLAFLVALMTVPRLRGERALYLVISVGILFSSIGMEWLYKGLEQYTYITVRSVVFQAVALVALFLMVHKRSDYVIYGGITVFAASASSVLNLLSAHRYVSFRKAGVYDFRRHVKPILVFFAMTVATTVYTNLDTVMLGFMTTDADVGFYNVAVKVKGILVSLVTSLGTVLLPRASYYFEHGEMEEFRRIAKRAVHFVFLAAVPLMVYFVIFARPTILLLSGRAFVSSVPAMQIIMPTLLLIGVSNITGIQILVPMGQEKVVLHSEVAGAVTDLIFNAALIPYFRAAGAAAGTVAAEAVVLVWQCVAMKKLSVKGGDALKADEEKVPEEKVPGTGWGGAVRGVSGNGRSEAVKDVPGNGRSEAVRGVPGNGSGVSRGLFGEVRYGAVVLACLLATGASFWVGFLRIGSFLQLALSAVLFFGGYVLALLWLKEPLGVELAREVIGKLRRKR